jgi:hypothetical protein
VRAGSAPPLALDAPQTATSLSEGRPNTCMGYLLGCSQSHLCGQHYFDDNEPVAEKWATSGKGVMTLAMSADLDQRDLEPGAIDWAVEPFRYPSN